MCDETRLVGGKCVTKCNFSSCISFDHNIPSRGVTNCILFEFRRLRSAKFSDIKPINALYLSWGPENHNI
jgi:hypothetical protein